MPAADYQAGGIYGALVQDVMTTCSCSRLRAVSALKACGNDAALAISSLQDMAGDSLPTCKENLPPTRPANLVSDTQVTAVAPGLGIDQNPASFDAPTLVSSNSAGDVRSPPPVNSAISPSPISRVGDSSTGYKLSEIVSAPGHINSDATSTPDLVPSLAPLVRNLSADLAAALPSVHISAREPSKEPSQRQWDFRLPQVFLEDAEDAFTVDEGRTKPFSPRRLISILQNGMSLVHLQHYLSFFSKSALRQHINDCVSGYPAMFYLVATNDPKLLRTWAYAGGDVNVVDPFHGIPLVAFATLNACAEDVDSTKVVVELLSLGADVSVVPPSFFSPFMEDPVDKLPLRAASIASESAKTAWCKDWIMPLFAKQLNLTQRYFMDKATKNKGPTERQLQVAQVHGATALLGISSFLIGQTSAAQSVTHKLLAHMALPRSKPMVMVFAGPSGHGKTELARRMGELLSLEMESVDCTEMKYETDLFGPKKPYIGYEIGAPLNNFLSRMSGKPSIVFLDEFEKTNKDVRNALLIPFDEGKHIDRRNRTPIDCSQTIWIMATNAVDDIILNFCDAHKEIFHDHDPIQQLQLSDEMAVRMRNQLKAELGNPLVGRITAVIPFLPFTPAEAAVIAHKFILELKATVRQPVSSSTGGQLVGCILLDVPRDGAVCSLLASEGYDQDQGARSLRSIVDAKVEDELVGAYLEDVAEIQDKQPLTRYVVEVALNGMLVVNKAIE